jgi:hypothetical protein
LVVAEGSNTLGRLTGGSSKDSIWNFLASRHGLWYDMSIRWQILLLLRVLFDIDL